MSSQAKDRVCAEILEIMATYHEQELEGRIDTPGGLEHMGDVWSLFRKWERILADACKYCGTVGQHSCPNDIARS